jgi:hypothetical protein
MKMSQPNIPNITPIIDVTTTEALNIILASIGIEELALAHLLNTEAEKIQYAIGTLETEIPLPKTRLTFDQILALNKSTNRTLLGVAHKELILLNKLEETIDLLIQLNESEHQMDESSHESINEEESSSDENSSEESNSDESSSNKSSSDESSSDESSNVVEEGCDCKVHFPNISNMSSAFFTGLSCLGSASGISHINGDICPLCQSVDSVFTYRFTEKPVLGENKSFSFTATHINPPTCLGSFSGLEISIHGEGTVKIASTGEKFDVEFRLTASGQNNFCSLLLSNYETDSFFSSFSTGFFLTPDSIIFEKCSY